MNSLKKPLGSILNLFLIVLEKLEVMDLNRLWRLEDTEPEFPIPEDGGLEAVP